MIPLRFTALLKLFHSEKLNPRSLTKFFFDFFHLLSGFHSGKNPVCFRVFLRRIFCLRAYQSWYILQLSTKRKFPSEKFFSSGRSNVWDFSKLKINCWCLFLSFIEGYCMSLIHTSYELRACFNGQLEFMLKSTRIRRIFVFFKLLAFYKFSRFSSWEDLSSNCSLLFFWIKERWEKA